MNVKQLKEIIEMCPDEMEVHIEAAEGLDPHIKVIHGIAQRALLGRPGAATVEYLTITNRTDD